MSPHISDQIDPISPKTRPSMPWTSRAAQGTRRILRLRQIAEYQWVATTPAPLRMGRPGGAAGSNTGGCCSSKATQNGWL